MQEDVPILPALVGVLIASYIGFELHRQRHRLREIFNVFDREDSLVAEALEGMVARGELQPYRPA
ncbi:hypothetical protein [Tautonia sociabilis]|uniref:Uncharacterized protein n=1 Tax=Tautonia sociabilis TaxID=2080755 RepID=A0A432MEJ0_9BACT|nr:hypothetical protein [Tautonia sociabilis]RUL83944.1 hypothetical protein TsocGM_21215 [Tautonia sociabilis]